MPNRRLSAALVCAALLAACAPSTAHAQTLRAAPAGRRLAAPAAEEGRGLKALFTESVAKARAGGPAEKAGGLSGAGLERSVAGRHLRQEESQPPAEMKWSKGKKAAIIVAIVAGVALIVWATANAVDDPTPFCSTDPVPGCIP